jgi:hypothetical protein
MYTTNSIKWVILNTDFVVLCMEAAAIYFNILFHKVLQAVEKKR